MKKTVTQLFLLIVLTMGLVGITRAASASEYRAHIPFDFTVGEKSFRAGDYSITFANLTSSQRRLIIRSADGKEAALVVVMPKETTKQLKNSVLVFDVSDDRYSLAEIKTNQLSAELYQTKSEEKLAKNSPRVELALTN
ncbi:MAG TPA: hypothetical protein VF721_04755 [Pyrinomonadaceae bacterium]|jgi:hypothetical protein